MLQVIQSSYLSENTLHLRSTTMDVSEWQRVGVDDGKVSGYQSVGHDSPGRGLGLF
jgi:hypothetical protein